METAIAPLQEAIDGIVQVNRELRDLNVGLSARKSSHPPGPGRGL
jgi:hypothetical protein